MNYTERHPTEVKALPWDGSCADADYIANAFDIRCVMTVIEDIPYLICIAKDNHRSVRMGEMVILRECAPHLQYVSSMSQETFSEHYTLKGDE